MEFKIQGHIIQIHILLQANTVGSKDKYVAGLLCHFRKYLINIFKDAPVRDDSPEDGIPEYESTRL